MFLHNLWVGVRDTASIPYSEFQTLARDGKISEVTISSGHIVGTLTAPRDGKTRFATARIDPTLAKELSQYPLKFGGMVESTFLRDLLSWVVPAVVFVAIWVFVMQRYSNRMGNGGFMNIGKSKAKVYVETHTRIDFADVAGVDEAKQELQEIVGFLKDPDRYGRLGGRAPKGVLLVGPPGTGKTLLARAVAGEAGVPFFSISGSEFVEMFVGVGAARVRDLFEQARAKGLVLLGATNRPEVLDPALLRAGRFDRQVLLDRPDKGGRIDILRVHAKKIRLAEHVDIARVADLTPGFTGAELANLCNEAALAATRRNASTVALEDFTVAIERIIAGLERKSRVLSLREREFVAHHEMGHALVAMARSATPFSDRSTSAIS